MSIGIENEVGSFPLVRSSYIDSFSIDVVKRNITHSFDLYMSKDDNTYIFYNRNLDFYLIWKHIGCGDQILELRSTNINHVSIYEKIIEDLL